MKTTISYIAIHLGLISAPINAAVTDQAEIRYLIETDLPRSTERAKTCDLCVHKLIPKQAQVGLVCDGELLIRTSITSLPRQTADVFASQIRSVAFSRMESLGFSLEYTHHDGACAVFKHRQNPRAHSEATAELPKIAEKETSEFIIDLSEEEKVDFLDALTDYLNTTWPLFFGPIEKSNYLDEFSLKAEDGSALLTYVVKPADEIKFRGIVNLRIESYKGYSDLIVKEDGKLLRLSPKLLEALENARETKGLESGRAARSTALQPN